MEWVVTTGKTIEEAKEQALDQLGVASDDAEFEVVEEPRTGLFGRIKTEARVRARVKPTQVRPKQDRRDRRRGKAKGEERERGGSRSPARSEDASAAPTSSSRSRGTSRTERTAATVDASNEDRPAEHDTGDGQRRPTKRRRTEKENPVHDDTIQSDVTPDEVGEAAVAFMSGLTTAFGYEASVEVEVDDTEIDVRVDGDELGLLVGPGGRTLTAVQDLARVASQRRLGDHETRLRIDVGGYREKRKSALEKFALAVANQVIESGQAKALEPMSSSDRKAVHDAITEIDGVQSRSEGDDPNRRVVIAPA